MIFQKSQAKIKGLSKKVFDGLCAPNAFLDYFATVRGSKEIVITFLTPMIYNIVKLSLV